jgi:hypothetical protein
VNRCTINNKVVFVFDNGCATADNASQVYDEKGKVDYEYTPNGNKYWEERDKGEWKHAPNIYNDDCEAFY